MPSSGQMLNSTVRSSGIKILCDDTKPVFVHGAYNLGPVYEVKLSSEAIHPGEGLDWGTGAGGEDTVGLMAANSTTACGIAEVDFGMILNCSVDYGSGDDIPVIYFHWMPGALLRNIVCVDTTAAVRPGTQLSTNSGTSGAFDDTAGAMDPLRAAVYNASAGAFDIVAWIHTNW